MPRPRKSLAALKASGALAHDRKRYADRAEVAGAGEIGKPPAGMTKEQRACWLETVAEVPPGILTGSDRTLIEMIAYLKAEMRKAPSKFPPQRLNQLRQCLGALGCTPADRSKVSGAGGSAPKPKSRLQQLSEGL